MGASALQAPQEGARQFTSTIPSWASIEKKFLMVSSGSGASGFFVMADPYGVILSFPVES
jgi:hypothetical protein